MAKCKVCKTDIAEGNDYCNDCQDKNRSSESYLDNLLKSVINSSESSTNYDKINSSISRDDDNLNSFLSTDNFDSDEFTIDEKDIKGYDELNIEEDLQDDFHIVEEDLYDEDLFYNNMQPINKSNKDTKDAPKKSVASFDEKIRKIHEERINMPKNEHDEWLDYFSDSENNINPSEVDEFSEEDSFDTALGDLLDLINSNDDKDTSQEQEEDYSHIDEDFMSLLNQNADDPLTSDLQAIHEMLNFSMEEQVEETMEEDTLPGDVGEVFSDALKVVSSLEDPNADHEELLNLLPNGSEEKAKKSKKEKKIKKKKANRETREKSNSSRVFKFPFVKTKKDNVEAIASSTNDETIEKNILEDNKVKKVKAKVDKKKKQAKVKPIKSSATVQDDNDDQIENNEDKKTKKQKTKNADQKAAKKIAKKENKLKKKKEKEIIDVIEEIEENEGKINRVTAGLVFVFLGILVVFFIVGTNIFSYSLSIRNATNYFERQKYTQAYNELYGLNIKDEDIEIYDKIMTVMYVNKQLNSYNNYYAIKKYPEALDSLLKGLSRYDKYIELATILGIQSDLDYVREQIIAELHNVFNLTEKEALSMMSNDNKTVYSMNVYNTVLEYVELNEVN